MIDATSVLNSLVNCCFALSTTIVGMSNSQLITVSVIFSLCEIGLALLAISPKLSGAKLTILETKSQSLCIAAIFLMNAEVNLQLPSPRANNIQNLSLRNSF